MLRQLARDNYSRHFLDLVQIRRTLCNIAILSLGASPTKLSAKLSSIYHETNPGLSPIEVYGWESLEEG